MPYEDAYKLIESKYSGENILIGDFGSVIV